MEKNKLLPFLVINVYHSMNIRNADPDLNENSDGSTDFHTPIHPPLEIWPKYGKRSSLKIYSICYPSKEFFFNIKVLNNANLESSTIVDVRTDTASSRPKKSVEFSDLQAPKTDKATEDPKIDDQIRRMAASAVAAAIAGATAKQISKLEAFDASNKGSICRSTSATSRCRW